MEEVSKRSIKSLTARVQDIISIFSQDKVEYARVNYASRVFIVPKVNNKYLRTWKFNLYT